MVEFSCFFDTSGGLVDKIRFFRHIRRISTLYQPKFAFFMNWSVLDIVLALGGPKTHIFHIFSARNLFFGIFPSKINNLANINFGNQKLEGNCAGGTPPPSPLTLPVYHAGGRVNR